MPRGKAVTDRRLVEELYLRDRAEGEYTVNQLADIWNMTVNNVYRRVPGMIKSGYLVQVRAIRNVDGGRPTKVYGINRHFGTSNTQKPKDPMYPKDSVYPEVNESLAYLNSRTLPPFLQKELILRKDSFGNVILTLNGWEWVINDQEWVAVKATADACTTAPVDPTNTGLFAYIASWPVAAFAAMMLNIYKLKPSQLEAQRNEIVRNGEELIRELQRRIKNIESFIYSPEMGSPYGSGFVDYCMDWMQFLLDNPAVDPSDLDNFVSRLALDVRQHPEYTKPHDPSTGDES